MEKYLTPVVYTAITLLTGYIWYTIYKGPPYVHRMVLIYLFILVVWFGYSLFNAKEED